MTLRSALPFLLAAGLAVVAFPGCAHQQKQLSTYEVNGAQYGVTEGPFRGRWWNYYERGRSYLEGGFYQEAQADFDAALAGRATDQLWARTYGMHFALEYFPNREKGISYYYQGSFSEAAAWLERSFDQRPSARAAYFLGQARKAVREAEGGDAQAPVVRLEPADGGTDVLSVRLMGEVTDDHFVDQVIIDGRPVLLALSSPTVSIDETVPVAPGTNRIVVEAIDLLGNRTQTDVAISVDAEGPAISFDEPITLNGPLSGVVYDASGVESVVVAGRKAVLQEAGQGVFRFDLGLELLDVSSGVEYTATDTRGNSTHGFLAGPEPPQRSKSARLQLASNGGLIALGLDTRGSSSYLVGSTNMAQETGGDLRVELVNVADGDLFYTDEIVVVMKVQSKSPISAFTLNGRDLPVIPGRTSATVSQRMPLPPGPSELHARLEDNTGASTEIRKQVTREVTEIDEQKNKLGVALVARPGTGVSSESGIDPQTVLDRIEGAARIQDRFRVVGRDLLPQILAEQELNQYLGSQENRLQMQMIAAEALFEISMRKDAASIELVVRAVGTETSRLYFNFIDAAGSPDELPELVEKIAALIVQEFPRVSAPIVHWDDPEIEFELGRSDRLRDAMKCVVYSRTLRGEPRPGEPAQYRTKAICQGLLTGVGADFTTADVLPLDQDSAAALEIPTGDDGYWVVIK